MIKIALAYQTR